jgi:DNA-binding transcriptional MerR regulator
MAIQFTKQQRCLPPYPKLGRRLAHWKTLVEELLQRRFTSGDVEQCIGLSRKVLRDWDHLGLLKGLYRGLGTGTGDERHGRWRLFSVFDIWTLALLKQLRDEGIHIERLRAIKDDQEGTTGLSDEVVPFLLYEALPYWVYRSPFWVSSDLRGHVTYGPAWQWKGHYYNVGLLYSEREDRDLFLSINLVKRMDAIFSLSRPAFEMVSQKDRLEFKIEGKRIVLEALPENDPELHEL